MLIYFNILACLATGWAACTSIETAAPADMHTESVREFPGRTKTQLQNAILGFKAPPENVRLTIGQINPQKGLLSYSGAVSKVCATNDESSQWLDAHFVMTIEVRNGVVHFTYAAVEAWKHDISKKAEQKLSQSAIFHRGLTRSLSALEAAIVTAIEAQSNH